MKYYEYIFQCEKLPTKHTLHALVTNFLGKEKINNIKFKVNQEGRLIKIRTNIFIDNNYSIEFFNKKGKKFRCNLYEVKEKNTKKYSKGQDVLLTGTIEYGINITGKKGKKCPVFLGRFENKELKEIFKNNIERNFGVRVDSMKNIYFNRLPSEILENHIQFNNIMNISIPVIIEDPSLFEEIEFNSYFQKKSYGFGSIKVISNE